VHREIGEDWGVSIYYETGGNVTEADYGIFSPRLYGLEIGRWVPVPDEHDEDGVFLRIGQFRISAKAGEEYNWGFENQEITIV